MSQYMQIQDVEFHPDFIVDYDNAPDRIKSRVDVVLNAMLDHGTFLPSMRIRETFKDDLWMGNITQKKQAWRILMWIDGDVVTLYRLLTHEQRDRFLKI